MTNIFLARFFGFQSDNLNSKSGPADQNRKWIRIVAIVVTFAFGGAVVEAQQPTKISRIGYLGGASLSANAARHETFRQGLRDLGYVEGKNIVIEWRSGEANRDRQRALAAELVRLKVDVIVAGGSGDIRAAKEATTTIPIVMINGGDAVGNSFVASLARPGGNITGMSTFRPELSGKRLELLKETVPRLSRVAVFASSTSSDYAQVLKELDLAAGVLGVKLQYLDVLSSKDVETTFRTAVKGRADAVLFRVPGPLVSSQRPQVAELAVKSRLPVMYERAAEVEAGGLMTYGVSEIDLDRRAATYVDKILKGRTPADLPVEQPMKFEFIINLKAAKQIGLTIPPNVLVRADKVIRWQLPVVSDQYKDKSEDHEFKISFLVTDNFLAGTVQNGTLPTVPIH
jgi:putative ABC transport system substrate-binding protein